MRLIIAALLFTTACLLGLGQAQHCTVACPRTMPTLIVLNTQSTYVYSLETKTVLTPRDTQKITIKADAEVSILSQCEAMLHLKNVVIEGVENGAQLAEELSSKPFAFGYFNGRVIGVCPSKHDEDWSQNIKKAVVSALQVQYDEDMDKVEEVDFSGKCPTNYRRLSNSSGVVVMEKQKELNLCDERRIDLHKTSPEMRQLKEFILQYIRPLNSEIMCRMTLKDQVVTDVDCEESHIFVRHLKAVHISNIKLRLKETKNGISSDDVSEIDSQPKQLSLSFDHKHKNPTESDVLEVLKKLCSEVSEESASIETSLTFRKLVDKLRYLSSDATVSVDEAVKSGSICPKAQKRVRELFLDATAFAATDGSIKTLVKAHNNEELSISRSTALFLVVVMKSSPSVDTVQSLLPLMQSEKTIRPLLLGFSVLVRQYCEKTSDCATNANVKDARDVYLSRLTNTKNDNEKMTIVRSLENLNSNTNGVDSMINSLDKIIKSVDEEPLIRAAAVEALPKDPASNNLFKNLVMDESLPIEVRVAAFRVMVKNNGLSHVRETFNVKSSCVKNYILTYMKNLKKSDNVLRNKLSKDIELPEGGENKIGSTRFVAREYGPYTFEYDIIYPENENITRSINARIIQTSKGELKELIEIQLYQKGFEKEMNNLLNMLERKISFMQFGITALKDLSRLMTQIRKNSHHHLRISVKMNGKNVMFSDVFEDVHKIIDLLRERFHKVINDKKVDRTIGSAFVDSKIVVPTITGFPLIFKLSSTNALQYNGEIDGEKDNRKININWSFISGIHSGMKLKVKNQKMGYEYDSILAYIPSMNLDIEKKDDHSLLFRINVRDMDTRTVIKFKQALREEKSNGEEKDYENELVPEARKDNCFTIFLLNYCRKESQIKGLLIPNVEYYVSKPEKEVTDLELELKSETDNKTRKYVALLKAIGSPTKKEAKAQIEINKGEEYKFLLKLPEHEFKADMYNDKDKNKDLKVKMNVPETIEAELIGRFEQDKETQVYKNKLSLIYKIFNGEQSHKMDYENEVSYNFKRSSKEKVFNFDYKSNYESNQWPFLNNRVAINFKYRPLKLNEFNLEFAYGDNYHRKYQMMRSSNMEVMEMKPFKLNGQNKIKLVATDLDINYDLKSDFKYEANKGTPISLEYNLKGKDRSRRAIERGQEDIDGTLTYKNKGSPIDSRLNASLKIYGNNYSYESELKQQEAQKYIGKIIFTKNNKKIFIHHEDEITKPTDSFHAKMVAGVTYSDSSDKKDFVFDFRKEKSIYTLKIDGKKNGERFYENNITVEKNGKTKWNYHRNDKRFNLAVDNLFNPKEAAMLLRVKDREYNVKMSRVSLRYNDIKVEGNDKALIKEGNLHMSLIDPISLTLTTKDGKKIDFFIDLISPNTKKATLSIDSKKNNLVHISDLHVSILTPRLSLKHYTKKNNTEYKVNADIARKGSLITYLRVSPEETSNIKYARQGDQINMHIDNQWIEGHIDGVITAGKIHINGKQNDFEIESTYKIENNEIIIDMIKNKSGKLEGIFSRKVPSKFVLETPSVKSYVSYNRFSPVKTFKFELDTPRFEKKTNLEYEPSKRYQYTSYSICKKSNKLYKIELNGIPKKALHMDLELPEFKFNVSKPENSNKAQFSYTFNNYTEMEEYEFDPNRAYLLNWLGAINHYVQSFIVE